MRSVKNFIQHHRIDLALMVVLTILTLGVRIPIASERKIMPAGDAYNFQRIASYIQLGQYPSQEKRLPGYPLFILLGRSVGFDPIQTSIAISIIASTGTILALYGLGRVFLFNRAALIAFLGLAIFDPLLTINGIRPLSDGLFVFLVAISFLLTALFLQYPQKATIPLQAIYSIGITFLMFTRYEGFLIVALTAPFLFIKLPWQHVLKMAALPVIAILLWVPVYKTIHGSAGGLSYITDATNPNGGFGELSLFHENLNRLMNGAGWRTAWAYPQQVFEKGISQESILNLFKSSTWLLSVLSIVGLIYILIIGRFAGFAIILAATGYTVLLSWWWVYSRYVAPLSILFYFGAAGGMTALILCVQNACKHLTAKHVIASLVPLITIPVLLLEAPKLYEISLNKAWESNRNGYALYRAMVDVSKKDGLVLYPAREHANATLYYGIASEKKSRKNAARGVYLSDFPVEKPDELYKELTSIKPRFFVETDYDKRIPELVALFHQHRNIKNTRTFKEVRWDTFDIEITNVHELIWP